MDFRPFRIMALPLPCKQLMAVRFGQWALLI
jgi:hypothetical protein